MPFLHSNDCFLLFPTSDLFNVQFTANNIYHNESGIPERTPSSCSNSNNTSRKEDKKLSNQIGLVKDWLLGRELLKSNLQYQTNTQHTKNTNSYRFITVQNTISSTFFLSDFFFKLLYYVYILKQWRVLCTFQLISKQKKN